MNSTSAAGFVCIALAPFICSMGRSSKRNCHGDWITVIYSRYFEIAYHFFFSYQPLLFVSCLLALSPVEASRTPFAAREPNRDPLLPLIRTAEPAGQVNNRSLAPGLAREVYPAGCALGRRGQESGPRVVRSPSSSIRVRNGPPGGRRMPFGLESSPSEVIPDLLS